MSIKLKLLTKPALEQLERLKAPKFAYRIPAGFPNPAEPYLDKEIDLNVYMGLNKPSIFLFEVVGDSMKNIGIHEGDLIVVDKLRQVKSNDVVVARLNGEFTLKRFVIRGKKAVLMPENEKYPEIELNEFMDFEIFGVVKYYVGHV